MTVTEREIESARDELRAAARARLGVTDDGTKPPPMREALRARGRGLYTLAAIMVLVVVQTVHSWGFIVLAPEIGHSFGLSVAGVATILTVRNIALALAPLPAAALARRPRRAALAIGSSFGWSVTGIATAFVGNRWGLFAASAVDGATSGVSDAVHVPLVMDSHPPAVRVRALTWYQAAVQGSNVIAPLLVAMLTGLFFLTWRGVFLVTGALSLLATLTVLRLRDPGFGAFDDVEIRNVARGEHTSDSDAIPDAAVELGFFEVMRRLTLIPTVRRLLVGNGFVGVLYAPFLTFLFFFLDIRWGMGATERGLFLAFVFGLSVVALSLFGSRGEALFRRSPGAVVWLGGASLGAAVGLICVAALVPVFPAMCLAFGVAFGLIAITTPSLNIATQSVVPAGMRPNLSALNGIAFAAGSILGLVFFSGVEARVGVQGALISVLVPGLIGAMVIASARRLVGPDLDQMIDQLLEEEELDQLVTAGAPVTMLACRGIDFYYGSLQVLFDVNFSVEDGEMVALLGVNGAGKSTLLRVISGIGLPRRGTVRYRGHDITYLDAERRVPLGITQVPGGRAVFGRMSVADNLRCYGHTLGRNPDAIREGIDRCFETFPKLHERRNHKAATLSGGEQQMLAMSKALLLKPRLLLIDELSLGLAPVVVGQLLDMIRHINAAGTSIVLVEQSVNVALGLVHHAYFMEKGQIRFDGRSQDLLARDDLLRAVFLEGVTGSEMR